MYTFQYNTQEKAKQLINLQIKKFLHTQYESQLATSE